MFLRFLVLLIFISSFSNAQTQVCEERKRDFTEFVNYVLKPKVLSNMRNIRLSVGQKGLPSRTYIEQHMNADILFSCDLFKDSENQPEFSKPFWAYDKSQDTDFLLKIKEVLEEHKETFEELEKIYSVDKEVLAAIWGKESKFGEKMGDIPVLQGVVFQSFRRRVGPGALGFWDQNVIYALQMMHSFDLKYEDFVGSWSGAFGHMQFIPSTYDIRAEDYDLDGISTHWLDDPKDALASAARLLKGAGWDQGAKWGEAVVLPETFNFQTYLAASNGGRNPLNQKFWMDQNVRANTSGELIDWTNFEGGTYLLMPQGSENTSYIVGSNFETLKAYNNADAYALSAIFLTEAAKGSQIDFTPAYERRTLGLAEKKLLQALLNKNGQNAGVVDGVIGRGTRRAIFMYQEETGVLLGRRDGLASEEVLYSLVTKFHDWTKNYIENIQPEIGEALYRVYSKKVISYETRPLSFKERRVLQRKLQESGLYLGEIDGIAGEATEKAVLEHLSGVLPESSSYMSREVYDLILSDLVE